MTNTAAVSPWRNLAWIAGALATSAAVVIGAVLAVVFAATVVVVGFIGSALFGLAAFAFRGRKVAGARNADDGLQPLDSPALPRVAAGQQGHRRKDTREEAPPQ